VGLTFGVLSVIIQVVLLFKSGKNQVVIATADGFIRIKNLQQAGKKQMPIEDFLRGNARLFL